MYSVGFVILSLGLLFTHPTSATWSYNDLKLLYNGFNEYMDDSHFMPEDVHHFATSDHPYQHHIHHPHHHFHKHHHRLPHHAQFKSFKGPHDFPHHGVHHMHPHPHHHDLHENTHQNHGAPMRHTLQTVKNLKSHSSSSPKQLSSESKNSKPKKDQINSYYKFAVKSIFSKRSPMYHPMKETNSQPDHGMPVSPSKLLDRLQPHKLIMLNPKFLKRVMRHKEHPMLKFQFFEPLVVLPVSEYKKMFYLGKQYQAVREKHEKDGISYRHEGNYLGKDFDKESDYHKPVYEVHNIK